MAQITFTIPDAKLPLVVSAIKRRWAVPTDSSGTPLFTDNQWAKEAIRRFIIDTVHSHEEFIAIASVTPDDTIAT